MWRGLIILTDYDCGHAYHLREVSRARTHDSMREEPLHHCIVRHGLRDYVLATADDLWHRPGLRSFFRRVSPAGIEPVGFRTKSDLRNHQAIIQPRLSSDSSSAFGIELVEFVSNACKITTSHSAT
jgi:hypothetical protein